MNWLAHILLAGPAAEHQLGGVLADLLSMPEAQRLSPGLRQGIALHQSIDAFTDAHPAVCASNRRLTTAGVGLRPAAAGIAVDMLYDHLLARDWSSYVPTVSLTDFADGFYRVASVHPVILSPNARRALDYMRTENWLESYGDAEAVRHVLERIRRRLFPRAAALSPLPVAMTVFSRDPHPFEEDFALFWPEVFKHTDQFFKQCEPIISQQSLCML